ncbi:MAG: hypothetical protein MRZ16_02060 [Parvimonas sp.]|uniref:hypothetical protein n=1 Tax=Parvimonas sp. TaxID=1944660 RepID=UPI0025D56E79|nr:hypothetical protein [Parvimonas sp.]MCI5997003.1 hypothetical protein [Parvimonas sp.]
MNLKEIEKKKLEIEKDLVKIEQEMDSLTVEIATLEAQAKVKNRKLIDLTEDISLKRTELRKLEIAKEILQTPAQVESTEETETEQPQKYAEFKAEFNYKKGEKFKIGNRLYEVVYDHQSDKTFNKLLTNKYQLIDEETGKPINEYSFVKTYNKFDKVLSKDHIYSSKIDNNNSNPQTSSENWIKID